VRAAPARCSIPRGLAREARQAEIVAANGGREAVIRRGSFAYSPPPGFKAELV
jgi:hypothetical protein